MFIALSVAAASAQAEWSNEGFFALADTEAYPVVGLTYFQSEGCSWPRLSIGDEAVTRVAIVVDGKNHGLHETEFMARSAVGTEVHPEIVDAMKRGKVMNLITDQGVLDISLKGATRAINANHAKCKSGW